MRASPHFSQSKHEIGKFVLVQRLLERTAHKLEKPKYSLFLTTRCPAASKPLQTNGGFVLDVLCAPSLVESRKGAVAAFGGSVSPPRSSNRTCGFPASGFPTGFIARHTAAVPNERAGGGAPRARRTPLRAESGWCRARAPCDVEPGSDGPARRRGCRSLDTPAGGCRS